MIAFLPSWNLVVVDGCASSPEKKSCNVIADSTLLDLMRMDSKSLNFESLGLPLSLWDTSSAPLKQQVLLITLLLFPNV